MASPTALITGCSKGGAGEAIATEFSKNGFRVFATARNLSKIEHLAMEGIDILELDVSSAASVTKAAAIISELTGGTFDVVINNAGAGNLTF